MPTTKQTIQVKRAKLAKSFKREGQTPKNVLYSVTNQDIRGRRKKDSARQYGTVSSMGSKIDVVLSSTAKSTYCNTFYSFVTHYKLLLVVLL